MVLRSRHVIAVLVIAAMPCVSSADNDAQKADAAAKKVLIITIDGCRPDALLAARTPHMDKLWQNGAFSFLARTDPITVSGPSFTSMLTGVWHEKHNVLSNAYEDPHEEEYPHLFHRIKAQRPKLILHSVVWWQEIHLILQPGDADHLEVHMDDKRVTELSAKSLSDSNPDVLFVHLNDVDAAGHKHGYGPQLKDYLAAIEAADGMVGTILEALHARPAYDREDWLVMVTTDHGGLPNKTHGTDTPQERTVFLFANGPSVTPGELLGQPAVVDVAVTALTHLGIEIDESWDLDGHAIGLRE